MDTFDRTLFAGLNKRRYGDQQMSRFAERYCVVCTLWILTVLLAPSEVNATWMWLGAASLGAVDVGRDAVPQPVTQATTNIMIDPATLCRQVPGLSAEQQRVCENSPDVINIISEGAKVGIIECQRQFRSERWNCSVVGDPSNPFGQIISTGNKETAFIYAITSAGVVYSVTRSCSRGNLTECGCSSPRGHPGEAVGDAEEWRWGGCSDNVDHGIRVAKKFVDAADKSVPERRTEIHVMNLHNNEAGRQIMKSQMMTQCRCHGVSASCSMKTCWKSMRHFSEIGDLVKRKYRDSIEVIGRTRRSLRLRRKDKRMRKVPIEADQLVFMQRSPNYCRNDPDRGIVGTTGRECNRTSGGSDSCDLLCCGRGYNTQETRKVERCDCKFIWCCKVKCRVCETVKDVHTCK